MDGGAWKAAVHGITESWTWLNDFTFTFHFHALEKEMASHSSVLAWRIPGTAEPGGLPPMGSHRVGHDWSDLAAAAAAAAVVDGNRELIKIILHFFSLSGFRESSTWNFKFSFWYGHHCHYCLKKSLFPQKGNMRATSKTWMFLLFQLSQREEPWGVKSPATHTMKRWGKSCLGTSISACSVWRWWCFRSACRPMTLRRTNISWAPSGLSPLPAPNSPCVFCGTSSAVKNPRLWISPTWHWGNSTRIRNWSRSWPRSMMPFWLLSLWSSRSHESWAQAWTSLASSLPCWPTVRTRRPKLMKWSPPSSSRWRRCCVWQWLLATWRQQMMSLCTTSS